MEQDTAPWPDALTYEQLPWDSRGFFTFWGYLGVAFNARYRLGHSRTSANVRAIFVPLEIPSARWQIRKREDSYSFGTYCTYFHPGPTRT